MTSHIYKEPAHKVFETVRQQIGFDSRRSEYRPNHPNSTGSSSHILNIGVLWACRPVNGAL